MVSRANFRCWLQADIQSPKIDVRFTPKSRHHGGHPEPPWQARGYEVEMRLFETDFSPHERDLIARAAGRVSDAAETDSPAPGNAHTAPISVRVGANYPCRGVGAPARGSSAHPPEAA
jgi:hypothetical protein